MGEVRKGFYRLEPRQCMEKKKRNQYDKNINKNINEARLNA